MKRLVLLLPLLMACKTSKESNCDAYGQMYINKDTITITTEHINYGNQCSTDTTLTVCIVDTLYIPKR